MKYHLLRNSFYSLIANSALAISNWVLLVIVARFFSPSELGEMVMALSILSPLYLFFSFKLRTLVIVDLENEYSISQYFNARLIGSSFALVLACIIGVVLEDSVSFSILICVALYKWFDAWCDLSYALHHRVSRFSQVAFSQFSRSITACSILLISAWIWQDIYLTLATWVAGVALFAFREMILCKNISKSESSVSLQFRTKVLALSSAPESLRLMRKYITMSMSLMMVSLFIYAPNFVIEYYLGTEEAGKFAIVSYFLVAGSILITSLSQVISPKLSELINAQRTTEYFSTALRMCGVGAGIGLIALTVVILAGEWVLTLVYGSEFSSLTPELVLVFTAAAVRYTYIFIGTALNSLKMFSFQTRVYSFGTCIVTVMCLILVPIYGTEGAAVALLVATVVEGILFFVRFFTLRSEQVAVVRESI